MAAAPTSIDPLITVFHDGSLSTETFHPMGTLGSSAIASASTPVPAATSPTSGTLCTAEAGAAGGVGVEVHLNGAGLARVLGEVALALEHGQVRVHGGRGGQPDRLADLPHRGRVAPVTLAVGDVVQDLQPLPAQDLGHRRLLWCPPRPSAGPPPGANIRS